MKRLFSWRVTIIFILLAASAVTYSLHYFIFRDLHHIFIYMVGDIAFLFLDVLLVILFIEHILSQREKRAILKKLNMVIGTFFSEVGMELLRKFSVYVDDADELGKKLLINSQWKTKDFSQAIKVAKTFSCNIQIQKQELHKLKEFLLEKRPFLLRLLENPNLLEHESFTDLLWAVFHIADELSFREGPLEDLPESDIQHLKGDIKRAYSQIISEWIAYTAHLKGSYPFLFSLAARINPLAPHPSPLVIEP